MTNDQPHTGARPRPAGIEGSDLPGPFAAGAYARQLHQRLKAFARVQVFGDLVAFRRSGKAVYFELRDEQSDKGGLPCAMWRSTFDRLGLGTLKDVKVVVAGGCEYYPGSATSSPSFQFRVETMRIAGDSDLLAEVERRREALRGEGLLEPQKWLHRPAAPASIGIVTSERGKARGDLLAALRRRGWAGRLVWAFAPVQDRGAAPAIGQACQDLAASAGVDVIIVARGGGSVMDLMAFSDETLCRTVAALSVPVIASVGHHTDRTLMDDVAAVSCSTPTHAAEAAVVTRPDQAHRALKRLAAELVRLGSRTVAEQRRPLEHLSSTVDSHDPTRVLMRGFALVETADGEPVTSVEDASGPVRLRFHDGAVGAVIDDDERS